MQAVSAGHLRVVSGRRGRLPVIVCGGRQVRVEGGDAAWAGLVRGEGEDPFNNGGSGGRGGLSGPCEGDGCWDEEGLPSLALPLAEGRGLSVPHRPFTHGASSTAPRTTPAAPLRTGD